MLRIASNRSGKNGTIYILTTDSAAVSDSAIPELGQRTLENAIRVLRGEVPLNLVNPEVKGKYLARGV